MSINPDMLDQLLNELHDLERNGGWQSAAVVPPPIDVPLRFRVADMECPVTHVLAPDGEGLPFTENLLWRHADEEG